MANVNANMASAALRYDTKSSPELVYNRFGDIAMRNLIFILSPIGLIRVYTCILIISFSLPRKVYKDRLDSDIKS